MEEELLSRIADGDISCLESLYERYKGRLMTYLYYNLFDRAKAEDILQETFIRVFRHAGSFKKGKSFAVWLYSIAKNLCRDEWRSRRRHRDVKLALPLDKLPHPTAGSSGSPSAKASGREFTERLLSELGELAPEQREAITLHLLSSMKYREIAQIVGCPVGTVQSRIHAGMKILRARMKDFWV